MIKIMKLIKSIFWNPFAFLILSAIVFMFIISYLHTTPKCYIGTVIEVSSWDGYAKLKTKTKLGKDTILRVTPKKRERFVVGQIITAWTGGDLFSGIASTDPQH